MNRKGMTIVELIVSFTLTAVIALFLTEIVLFLKNTYTNNGIKTEIVNKQTLISDRIYSLLNSNKIVQVISCGDNCTEIQFEDGTISQIAFNNNKVIVGDYVTNLPKSCIVGDITVGTENFSNTDNYNSLFQIYVPITSNIIKNRNFDINVIYQYNDNEQMWAYNENKNEYYLSIPDTSMLTFRSNFDLLDGVTLLDQDNNEIDVEIKYQSVPDFSSDVAGEYKVNYYTFYDGKTYIASKTISVIQSIHEYVYTDDVQEYTVPVTGTYKLEVWGAQGGGAKGGYGGYSVGEINLEENTTLYVMTGGQPTNGIGGNNGGGTITGNSYGGGGATHISSTSGLLRNISSDNLYLVAGGGGGSGSGYAGGAAGGYKGCDGVGDDYGRGGTQSTGGGVTSTSCGATVGAYGYGGSGSWHDEAIGGGGGGYYGGGSGGGSNNNGGGGGGSGYIGNDSLSNKYMYCSGCSESTTASTYTINTIGSSTLKDTVLCPDGYSENPISKCAKSGNGHARITYIGD